jgi:hypothetical protein
LILAVSKLVWLRTSTQPHLSTVRKSWFDDMKVGFKWVNSGFDKSHNSLILLAFNGIKLIS